MKGYLSSIKFVYGILVFIKLVMTLLNSNENLNASLFSIYLNFGKSADVISIGVQCGPSSNVVIWHSSNPNT